MCPYEPLVAVSVFRPSAPVYVCCRLARATFRGPVFVVPLFVVVVKLYGTEVGTGVCMFRLARATFRGPDVRTWFEGWLVPSCRRRLVFRRRLVQVVDSSC